MAVHRRLFPQRVIYRFGDVSRPPGSPDITALDLFLSQYVTNLMHKICFTVSFYFMPLHVSSICAHHHEVKSALHSLWYHHTYRWPSSAQFEIVLSQTVHETATYGCDNTRGCVTQFWPHDDVHMCSKHVEAWSKNLLWNKFCASSWLKTEINILRCSTVSKTSKFDFFKIWNYWKSKVCSRLTVDSNNTYEAKSSASPNKTFP